MIPLAWAASSASAICIANSTSWSIRRGTPWVPNEVVEAGTCVSPKQLLQRLALQTLHYHEGLAFVLPEVVDRAYIMMIEGGGGARLALEALQRFAVICNILGQELDCDGAIQASILSLIDDTHPPCAELFNNAVVRNRLADQVCETLFDEFPGEASSPWASCWAATFMAGDSMKSPSFPS